MDNSLERPQNIDGWNCACGKHNKAIYRFCTGCGKPRSLQPSSQGIQSQSSRTPAFTDTTPSRAEGAYKLGSVKVSQIREQATTVMDSATEKASALVDKAKALTAEKQPLIDNAARRMTENASEIVDKAKAFATEKQQLIDIASGQMTEKTSGLTNRATEFTKKNKSIFLGTVACIALLSLFLLFKGNGMDSSYSANTQTGALGTSQSTPQTNRTSSSKTPHQQPEMASDLGLGGICIGDAKEKVFDLFGKGREEITPSRLTYEYSDLKVWIDDGRVSAMVSNTGNVSTKRNIHQGSTLQEVLHAYGNNYSSFTHEGMQLYEYSMKSINQWDCLLRFAIKDNRVDYISIRALLPEKKPATATNSAPKTSERNPAASSNKMPREEMYIGGVGAGVSLGYVKQVYGEPREVKRSKGDGIRSVTYIYSDTFSITGRTGIRDDRPENELIVVGFSCTNPSLTTKGGIKIGMSYKNAVVSKYGPGQEFTPPNGERMYIYDGGKGMQFCFYVDKNDGDTIIKIYQGTEW